jgi:DNA-binding NarL/FixJ family response regulator
MKRLVVVADNPMIVGAIRSGIRADGAFQLLGYADPRKTTAARIVQAGAEVVLVDEVDSSDTTIALIRGLKAQDDCVRVIVLTLVMNGEWLERAFEAGATCAMSKAIHPSALSTLLRAVVSGHIVHSPASIRSVDRVARDVAREHSSLTARELEILQLLASGASNADIARELWITQQTVKFHVSNVYRKLDVGNRTEACHYAHVNGLVAPRLRRKSAPFGEALATAS